MRKWNEKKMDERIRRVAREYYRVVKEMEKVDEGEDWEVWSNGKRYVYIHVTWDDSLSVHVKEGQSEEEAKEGEDIYEFYL